MNMNPRTALILALLGSSPAFGQDFPSAPIRAVVPTGPGTAPDLAVRVMQPLREQQRCIVCANRVAMSCADDRGVNVLSDLLEQHKVDIEIGDIAHGLARVARWNGQTTGEHAFSVAQHSLVVEEIAAHIKPDLEPRWRLAALLHDASEYVIGDMISPFKAALGVSYKDFEARLEDDGAYLGRSLHQVV